jgi:hypothetical protein
MKKKPKPKKKAKTKPKEDFNQAAFRVVLETEKRGDKRP